MVSHLELMMHVLKTLGHVWLGVIAFTRREIWSFNRKFLISMQKLKLVQFQPQICTGIRDFHQKLRFSFFLICKHKSHMQLHPIEHGLEEIIVLPLTLLNGLVVQKIATGRLRFFIYLAKFCVYIFKYFLEFQLYPQFFLRAKWRGEVEMLF